MKVWQLLDSPDKWIQNQLAQDSQGKSVNPEYESGCKWCLAGAICTCYPKTWREVWNSLNDTLKKRTNSEYCSVPGWNDNPKRKWEDVYNLCKELNI